MDRLRSLYAADLDRGSHECQHNVTGRATDEQQLNEVEHKSGKPQPQLYDDGAAQVSTLYHREMRRNA